MTDLTPATPRRGSAGLVAALPLLLLAFPALTARTALASEADLPDRLVTVANARDKSQSLSVRALEAVHTRIERTVDRHGLAVEASAKGFYVSPVVASVTRHDDGEEDAVYCQVDLVVSRWSEHDGKKSLDSKGGAAMTARGKVPVARSSEHIDQAAQDCTVSVAEVLTSSKVVPYVKQNR